MELPAWRMEAVNAEEKPGTAGGDADAAPRSYVFFPRTQENAGQYRTACVHGVEQRAETHAVEEPLAQDAENEGRAGVVAEAEQTASLRPGNPPAFIKRGDRLRARRVAAQKPQHQRRRSRAADPEQGAHDGPQHPPEPFAEPQRGDQVGEHKEGEQRGDQHCCAELQPARGSGGGQIAPENQRRGHEKRGKTDRQPFQKGADAHHKITSADTYAPERNGRSGIR
jgi:hypothetical protein